MRWPWRRQARRVEPRQAVRIRAQELETAKEILVEVFHARPREVEEMIQRRLEERSWDEEETWQKEREEGRWPATFSLGE
jgi:hypothetical protein